MPKEAFFDHPISMIFVEFILPFILQKSASAKMDVVKIQCLMRLDKTSL